MNKNKEKIFNRILLALYIALALIFTFSIISIPKWVKANYNRYIYDVEHDLFNLFALETEDDLALKVKEFRKNYPLEISIVKQDGTVLYQSLPGIPFFQLQGVIQPNVIMYETQGTIEGSESTYNVWFSIYYPSLQKQLELLFFTQLFMLALMTIIIILIIIIMQKQLVRPLNNVKRSLKKLNRFELESIAFDADDVISEDMSRFAVKLSSKIKAVSRNHTELEFALQLERERLENILDIARGIIHDLKTPLHSIILENDLVLNDNEHLPIEARKIALDNIDEIDVVIQRINEVLKMLNSDINAMVEKKDVFDLIALYEDIETSFHQQLDAKRIMIDLQTDEKLHLSVNKTTMYLIIHNLLSNVSKYAMPGSDVVVELYKENDWVHIIFSNKSTIKNLNRIKESENLFMAEMDESGDNEYIYSTGNGVYLIKELAQLSGGSYQMDIDEMKEEITICLKIPAE